jgi:hypothetical protein
MMSNDFLKWLHDFLGLAQPKAAEGARDFPAPVSGPVAGPETGPVAVAGSETGPMAGPETGPETVRVHVPEPVSAREYAQGVWPGYPFEAYGVHHVRAVVSQVAETPPERWLSLVGEASIKHAVIQVRDLAGYALLPVAEAVVWLGTASLNWSGFVREEAVQRLGETGRPEAVPFVILRLNDWADPVAAKARGALEKLLTPGCAAAFVKHYRVVEWLRGVGRTDGGAEAEAIEAYLSRVLEEGGILAFLESQDAAQRLFVLRLMFKREELQGRALDLACRDRSIRVACWGARENAALPVAQARARLVLCLKHPSTQVRLAALRGIGAETAGGFEEELRGLLGSGVSGVREGAGYLLRRHVGLDVAGIYRGLLAETAFAAVTPGVVAGMGETGSQADFDAVALFVGHGSARVREQALKALARLDGARAVGYGLEKVEDPSPRVRRVAVLCLENATFDVVRPLAWWLLEKGTGSGSREVFELLKRDRFTHCAVILWGLGSGYVLAEGLAWQSMEGWSRDASYRGWLRPTEEDRLRIVKYARVLEEKGAGVPRRDAGRYRAFLKQVGEVVGEGWIGEIGG